MKPYKACIIGKELSITLTLKADIQEAVGPILHDSIWPNRVVKEFLIRIQNLIIGSTVLCKSVIQWKVSCPVEGVNRLKCLIQLHYKSQRLSVYIVTETGAIP